MILKNVFENKKNLILVLSENCYYFFNLPFFFIFFVFCRTKKIENCSCLFNLASFFFVFYVFCKTKKRTKYVLLFSLFSLIFKKKKKDFSKTVTNKSNGLIGCRSKVVLI